MQPIIHQAEVLRSGQRIPTSPLKMDTPLRLEPDATGCINVLAKIGAGRFLARRETETLLGTLGPSASDILRPALQRGVRLRVRIVNLMPACLSGNGHERVFLSVWGDAKEFGIIRNNRKQILTITLPELPPDEILSPEAPPIVPEPEEPAPFRIFSRARIRDLLTSADPS